MAKSKVNLNKGISEEVKNQIRAYYIMGKFTVKELSEKFRVSQKWIYERKNKEQWDLLSKDFMETNREVVVEQSLSNVYDSIDFYSDIMTLCKALVKKCINSEPRTINVKGVDVETLSPLTPSEIKSLIEAYQIAENNKLLLLSVKLKGDEDEE